MGWASGVSAEQAARQVRLYLQQFLVSLHGSDLTERHIPPPHVSGKCCFDGTKKEKRAHALWIVKNRNVGPEFYYHFDHQGKKIH